MKFVVGVGASGEGAALLVDRGIASLLSHPAIRILGRSRRYQNPAWGGVTRALFVNAAVVVESALAPSALLRELHAVESAHGRLRRLASGPRTLDLDVLLAIDVHGGGCGGPDLPHPRLIDRAFAVIPALEALASACLQPPPLLLAAARNHARAAMILV